MNYEFKVNIGNNNYDLIVGWRPKTFSQYEYKIVKKADLIAESDGSYYTTIKFNLTKKQIGDNKFEYNDTTCFVNNGLDIDVYSFQVGTDTSIYGWLNTSYADSELKSNIDGEHDNRDRCIKLGSSATINAKQTDALFAPKGIGIYFGSINKIVIKRTKSAEYPLNDSIGPFDITIHASGKGGQSQKTKSNISASFTKIENTYYNDSDTETCLYISNELNITGMYGTITITDGLEDNDVFFTSIAKINPKELFAAESSYSLVDSNTNGTIDIVREHTNSSEFGSYDMKWVSIRTLNSTSTEGSADSYSNIYVANDYPNQSSSSLYPCSVNTSNLLNVNIYSISGNKLKTIYPSVISYSDGNKYYLRLIDSASSQLFKNIILPNVATTAKSFVLGSNDFVKIM